jgi:hypothetical protein
LRKALVVLIAIMLASAAAWAQADALLGPHNTNQAFGCQSCHTPHSATMAGKGLYLWAMSTPSYQYTTYGGATFTPNLKTMVTPTGADAASVHTVLCLSCHDSAFNPSMNAAPGTEDPNTKLGPVANGYSTSTNILVGPSGSQKAGHSMMITVGGNVNGATQGDLTSNHPTHVIYPNGSASGTYDNQTKFKFWKVSGTSFVDTTFTYGHSARLFSDGAGSAYVECGSCHNPHAQNQTLVTVGGNKVKVNTSHFVRGAYTATADNANFCMSCHADKSAAWDGSGNQ